MMIINRKEKIKHDTDIDASHFIMNYRLCLHIKVTLYLPDHMIE